MYFPKISSLDTLDTSSAIIVLSAVAFFILIVFVRSILESKLGSTTSSSINIIWFSYNISDTLTLDVITLVSPSEKTILMQLRSFFVAITPTVNKQIMIILIKTIFLIILVDNLRSVFIKYVLLQITN